MSSFYYYLKKNMITQRYRLRGRGFVLFITLVVLFVLAALGYSFASRVAANRHRNNYIIDYTIASYARDSAIKYALTVLQDINDVKLIDRPNEPDFSDLFAMSEQNYRKMLDDWAKELAREKSLSEDRSITETRDETEPNADTNALNFGENESGYSVLAGDEPNVLKVRGPYGPEWPFVTEPVEFEIGDATVKIEIEDENAKYPVGWAMLEDTKVRRESEAGLETFCEWMGYEPNLIGTLEDQFKQVGEIKPFKTKFEPIVKREEASPAPRPAAARGRRVVTNRAVFRTTTVQPAEQIVAQAKDFSKLMQSSLIDTEMLARPTIVSDDRRESALKYMGLWGAAQVNINSAPRHVLEAAFAFGGDAEKIADEIIKERRKKPFTDIEDLKKRFFRYSDAIEKSSSYITTASSFFSIHVTVSSGSAKASAVVVVYKDAGRIQHIAIVRG
jgi:hypothetical protein